MIAENLAFFPRWLPGHLFSFTARRLPRAAFGAGKNILRPVILTIAIASGAVAQSGPPHTHVSLAADVRGVVPAEVSRSAS